MKVIRPGKTKRERPKQAVVVDASDPVDYSGTRVPVSYRCGTCGATGCKLWREYNAFLENQSLRCAPCAGADQGKDVSDIDADGMRSCEIGGRTDQIGWLIPAVPTEENDTYWGYSSVPEAGVRWWKRLPTLLDLDPRYAEGRPPD